MIAINFFTDSIDGYLTRKFNVACIAGAKLDSIADDLSVIVSMAAVFVFKTEFVKEELIIFIYLFALLLIQTIYALFRYGKKCGCLTRQFFHFTFFSPGTTVSAFLCSSHCYECRINGRACYHSFSAGMGNKC
jgi:phosphatidylglycerophosphate synthase